MLRCAIVPPVPVPYREPLFQRLAARPDLTLRVIFQASSQASWDQAAGWFPADHGYDAVRLAARHIARRGRSPITWARGLERALADFDPDVVVVSEFGPATLRALAWCRRRGRALVVLTEVTGAAERTLSPPQRRLHRWLAQRVDGFVAVSSAARERLLALGAAPEAVAVSLQSVDEDALLAAARAHGSRRAMQADVQVAQAEVQAAQAELQAARAEVQAAQAELQAARAESGEAPVEVLTVARLVPDKDVGALIQAFAQAGLAGGEATLSIVGGGPLEDELREQAQALGVPARFCGAVPASELPARYASAGVFALCSRYEPFGVALREAVVAGLPVVCSTAVGAAADFAHADANALLFAPGDIDALAQALSRLCRDAGLRRELGAGSTLIASERTLAADVEAFAAMVARAAREAGVSRAASAARARR